MSLFSLKAQDVISESICEVLNNNFIFKLTFTTESLPTNAGGFFVKNRNFEFLYRWKLSVVVPVLKLVSVYTYQNKSWSHWRLKWIQAFLFAINPKMIR